jgi:hypothetical protein
LRSSAPPHTLSPFFPLSPQFPPFLLPAFPPSRAPRLPSSSPPCPSTARPSLTSCGRCSPASTPWPRCGMDKKKRCRSGWHACATWAIWRRTRFGQSRHSGER